MLTQALLRCTVALLDDACPFDPRFYRCGLLEDDLSEDSCAECWRAYLVWLTQASDPYASDRPDPLPPTAAADRLQTALSMGREKNFSALPHKALTAQSARTMVDNTRAMVYFWPQKPQKPRCPQRVSHTQATGFPSEACRVPVTANTGGELGI